MAKRQTISRPGFFGWVYHFDEAGNCIGKSRPGLFGDRTIHYDTEGNHTGTSYPGILADEVHFVKGKKISSYKGLFGRVHCSNGRKVGHTRRGLFDTDYTTLEEEE